MEGWLTGPCPMSRLCDSGGFRRVPWGGGGHVRVSAGVEWEKVCGAHSWPVGSCSSSMGHQRSIMKRSAASFLLCSVQTFLSQRSWVITWLTSCFPLVQRGRWFSLFWLPELHVGAKSGQLALWLLVGGPGLDLCCHCLAIIK